MLDCLFLKTVALLGPEITCYVLTQHVQDRNQGEHCGAAISVTTLHLSSILSLGSCLCGVSEYVLLFPLCLSSKFSSFLPPKIMPVGYLSKINCECVCTLYPLMDWHSIHIAFPPHAQSFSDRLQNYCDLFQNVTVIYTMYKKRITCASACSLEQIHNNNEVTLIMFLSVFWTGLRGNRIAN